MTASKIAFIFVISTFAASMVHASASSSNSENFYAKKKTLVERSHRQAKKIHILEDMLTAQAKETAYQFSIAQRRIDRLMRQKQQYRTYIFSLESQVKTLSAQNEKLSKTLSQQKIQIELLKNFVQAQQCTPKTLPKNPESF